mmetsp:Transcript_20709/g.53941  ORF Transcript_20709/g.53941 Transcript_20709/m.53941 type:complete len:225 (+) Transcript_20709:222-896(+)
MVDDALRRGKVTVPDDYVALLEAHQALVVAVVDVVDERRRVEEPRFEPRRDRGAARVRDVPLKGAAADVGPLRRAASRARGEDRAAPSGPVRVAVVQVRAHGVVVQKRRVGQVQPRAVALVKRAAAPAVALDGLVLGAVTFERTPRDRRRVLLEGHGAARDGHVRRERRGLNQKVLLVAVLRVLAEGAAGVVRFVVPERRVTDAAAGAVEVDPCAVPAGGVPLH